MAGMRRISRRRFLGRSARLVAGAAVPLIVPSSVLGLSRRPSPSNRLTMGIIGTGGMGIGNMRSFMWHDRVQVVAVCDVDRAHREEAKGVAEKHYSEHKPSGRHDGIGSYGDFRDLIARDDIDLVCIATPDHWHAPIAAAAARAGKDIYCEKPLTRTVAEGRALADLVRRTGRVLQVGSQQRSDRRFRLACELVRNGRIGRLRKINVTLPTGASTGLHAPEPVPEGFDYDMWLGPAPWAPYVKERCHYNWRHQRDYAGGEIADWGAHHIDIAHWGMGLDRSGPVEVSGTAEWPEDGLWDMPVRFEVAYRYANGVTLVVKDHSWERFVSFEGSDGTVTVSRQYLRTDPPSLAKSRIGPGEDRLEVSTWHHGNFIDAVLGRRDPVAPAEVGHRSATACHLGNLAVRLGRRLRWDPEREKFVDDSAADRHLSRANRSPWRT